MSKTKITNDQGDIIEALREKNYIYAWEKVKYVGFKDVPDINERHLVFYIAAQRFNTEINNNFIIFYKQYLRYFRLDQNETFRVTTSRPNIKRLKEQAISPTKGSDSKIIDELKKWNN